MRWIRLVGNDLRDRDRIERAARAAGLAVRDGADGPPLLVVVDLDREGVPQHLGGGRIVGYYSHVNEAAAAAAAAQGIEAIPRGRFWRTIDELLAELPA